jgi:hypothetical protein
MESNITGTFSLEPAMDRYSSLMSNKDCEKAAIPQPLRVRYLLQPGQPAYRYLSHLPIYRLLA